MKKLPRITFILLMILIMSFSMTSCNKKTEVKPMSVKDALDTGNGKAVTLSGTVYFVDNEGIFLETDGSYIFVKKTNDIEIKVGDLVKVKGYYSFFESYSMITGTESIEVVSNNNTVYSPTKSTIFEIVNTNKNTKDIYSKYVSVKGLLSRDSTGFYLSDLNNNKLYISGIKETNLLMKIVEGNFVIKKYSDSLGFIIETNEIKESAYTISDIKPLIENELSSKVSTVVYDKFNNFSSSIDGVTYETSFRNSSFTTTSYIQSSKKNEDTLIVKALYNSESLDYSYNVVLMPNTAIDISEFIGNKASVNKSVVSLKGIVIAKLNSNSTGANILIVKDINTSDSIMLTSNNIQSEASETFNNIFIGNTINFTAQYAVSGTYKNSFTTITKLTSDFKYTKFEYDFSNAVTLNDIESYSKVGLNFEDYYGKLIKFENPYLSMSSSKGTVSKAVLPLYTVDERAIYSAKTYGSYSSVSTNAVFDSNETYYTYDSSTYTKAVITEFASGVTYYTRTEANKVFGFNIDNNNLTYGCSSWYTSIDIPSKNYNYERFDRDIYCYIVPSSKSYIEVIMASPDFYKIYNDENEEQKYYDMVTTAINKDYYANGTYYLPYYLNKDLFEYSIPLTIKCDSELVKLTKTTNSGSTVYKMVITTSETSKTATLNIEYSVNDNKYNKDVIINIANNTVTDIKTIRSNKLDTLYYAKGVIVGFASETNKSTTTTKREFKGVLVKDLVTNDLVIVDGLEYFLGSLYPNFIVSGNTLKIGSVIEFKGRYIESDNRVTLRNGGSLSFVEQLSSVSYLDTDKNETTENIIVVHNQLELSEALYDVNESKEADMSYARIIKLVGTESNPIYFAPTSSNAIKSSGNMNFRVHYNSKATTSADTMINGYSVVLKQDNQSMNTNDELWYQEVGLPSIGVSGSMYPGAMAYTGTMYIAVVYNSSSSEGINCYYYSSTILNWENWNLEEVEDFNSSIERNKNE